MEPIEMFRGICLRRRTGASLAVEPHPNGVTVRINSLIPEKLTREEAKQLKNLLTTSDKVQRLAITIQQEIVRNDKATLESVLACLDG